MRKKAGAFFAKGADTCVYTPPVTCAAGTGPDLSGNVNSVSRIVHSSDPEVGTQDRLKVILENVPDVVKRHFVVYDTHCIPEFRAPDSTEDCMLKRVKVPTGTIGARPDLVNLVTKKFAGSFDRLVGTLNNRTDAIRDLCVACMYLYDSSGGTILHMDTHGGNIAVIQTPPAYVFALNDWGRSLYVNVNSEDPHEFVKFEADKNAVYSRGIDNYFATLDTDYYYQYKFIAPMWKQCVQWNDAGRWRAFFMCVNVLGILGLWYEVAVPQQKSTREVVDFIYNQIETTGDLNILQASVIAELKRGVVAYLFAPPARPPGAPIIPPSRLLGPLPAAPAPARKGGRKTRRFTRGSRPPPGAPGPKRSRSSRPLRSRASSARSPPSAS